MSVLVATFYKFFPLQECVSWQRSLQTQGEALHLRGTILLATEGINATIAGQQDAVITLVQSLQARPGLADLRLKTTIAPVQPFERWKVKIKREIVTLGRPDANPLQRVGTYVPAADWNRLVTDPEVVVIDARNTYEVNIGTFQGALNPETQSFRQLPESLQRHLDPERHRRVALFCTGGIRCEKATAYLLNQGFEQVYHLQEGILKYLETIPESESLWQGECFVFDQRVSVRHGLQPGTYDLCRACGNPISRADQQSPQYEPGISCPHCYASLTPAKRAKQRMRQCNTNSKKDSCCRGCDPGWSQVR